MSPGPLRPRRGNAGPGAPARSRGAVDRRGGWEGPVWIVLPLKEPALAKSRLAPQVGRAARGALAWALARHTLGILQQLGDRRVVVVSRLPAFLALARGYGFAALRESAEGHSAAVRQGAEWATDQGAAAVLALAADLPLLGLADVGLLLGRAGPDRAVLAPDRSGLGTNAVVAPPDFPFSFGSPSLARHVALATASGLNPILVRTRGLALDVDTPEDLALAIRLQDGSLATWAASNRCPQPHGADLATPGAAGYNQVAESAAVGQEEVLDGHVAQGPGPHRPRRRRGGGRHPRVQALPR